MDVISAGSDEKRELASAPVAVSARNVTLTLCTSDGHILGELQSFIVPSPHLQDTDLIIRRAEQLLNQRVVVLRLLDSSRNADGTVLDVNYLAQVAMEPEGLIQPSAVRADHPRRMSWASPGGPDRDLAWAKEVLSDLGISVTGRPRQIRSWNLSSIWQITTDQGIMWLKAVPPFLAHEAEIVTALGSFHAPRVIASRDGLTLYEHAPGDDAYGAPVAMRIEMLRHLTDIHMSFTEDDIRRRGWKLPDWRPCSLYSGAVAAIDDLGDALAAERRRVLDSYLERWDDTSAELVACGVPFALVHGDFHPGNVRASEGGMTIIDWADSGIGHPGFDVETCAQGLDSTDGALLRDAWGSMWRSHLPGVDTHHVLRLLPPLAALRRAVVYRRFLDEIEPDERVYHAGDPARWLATAADAASTLSR